MLPRPLFAEGVQFSYGRAAVLAGLDLAVAPGEIVGILGSNGSGKSTLVMIAAGLLPPAAGRVDVPVRPSVVRDRLAFLEPLTGEENLDAMLALAGQAGRALEAAAWLSRFGLGNDARRPVSEYSLGMRRRLALAEAFATAGPLVVLDEPTLGLDPAGRDRLIAMLSDHSGEGLTVVLATNDAGFAELACDQVLLLHDGRVAARGTPAVMIAALEAPTLLEIVTGAPPPAAAPPAGLTLVARSPAGLTLAAPHASRRLPEVWAWLEAETCPVREIRVREPGLADVFRAHTGAELPVAPGVD